MKFSVVILKDVSMWEGSVNEKSGDFQFYCERAGWHFACAEKCMQILWSEDRGLVPVETDEALKMEAVKSQFRKQAVLLMVLDVLFAGIYFWPALMGAPSLAGYKLGVLLETNGGVLALFCMLYLFLSGLAGVVFYLVWCQAAKRAVSQKKPVRYRSYPLFRLKDIATKTFLFFTGSVLLYRDFARFDTGQGLERAGNSAIICDYIRKPVSFYVEQKKNRISVEISIVCIGCYRYYDNGFT